MPSCRQLRHGELPAELLRDGRDRGLRLAVVHAGRAEHADGAGDSPSTRYGASTIEHSRSSSSWFSEPMRTVSPGPSSSRTSDDDHDLVLEQLEEPRRGRRPVNASCSAASRLAPPT